jgi:hypothetical protein
VSGFGRNDNFWLVDSLKSDSRSPSGDDNQKGKQQQLQLQLQQQQQLQLQLQLQLQPQLQLQLQLQERTTADPYGMTNKRTGNSNCNITATTKARTRPLR